MKSYRHFILREPASTDGGSSTPTATPAPTPKQPMPQRIDMPKAVPDNIKKMTFDVADFDVQQLPTTPPVKVEDTKTGVVTTAKETDTTGTAPTPDNRERNPDGTFKEVKKTEEKVKVEEKAKAEPQSILKPPAEKKAETAPVKGKEKVTTVTVPQKVQRDYTGHSTEEVEAFKKMSDEAYQFTKSIIMQNRELKKLEGSTYLQHEHAYVLDPEFQQMRQKISLVQSEASHWRDCLIKLAEGKPIRDIKGWDSRTGQMILGDEHQPTAALTEDVRSRMITAQQMEGQIKGQLETFPTKYSSRIKEDTQLIEQEIKNRFEWEKRPELMDHTLTVEFEDGPRDISLKQIKEDFMSLFPPYLRQNLGVKVAANMMIALKIQDAQIRQLQAGSQVAQIQQDEQRLKEPTSEVKPTAQTNGKPVHGVTEFGGNPLD